MSKLHTKPLNCAATFLLEPTAYSTGSKRIFGQCSDKCKRITNIKRIFTILYISVYLKVSEWVFWGGGVSLLGRQTNGIDNQRHIVLNLRAQLFLTTVNPQNSKKKKKRKKKKNV